MKGSHAIYHPGSQVKRKCSGGPIVYWYWSPLLCLYAFGAANLLSSSLAFLMMSEAIKSFK
jgi:hypothetical protein